MSTGTVAPTWWQRRRALVKTTLWSMIVFLTTAAVLWWLLPAEPSLVLPDDQKLVAFSKDGQAILTARTHRLDDPRAEVYAGPIQSWDIRTGEVRRLAAAAEGIWQRIVFSPDDRVVATQRDNVLKLWEVSTGRAWPELHGGQGLVGPAPRAVFRVLARRQFTLVRFPRG